MVERGVPLVMLWVHWEENWLAPMPLDVIGLIVQALVVLGFEQVTYESLYLFLGLALMSTVLSCKSACGWMPPPPSAASMYGPHIAHM